MVLLVVARVVPLCQGICPGRCLDLGVDLGKKDVEVRYQHMQDPLQAWTRRDADEGPWCYFTIHETLEEVIESRCQIPQFHGPTSITMLQDKHDTTRGIQSICTRVQASHS